MSARVWDLRVEAMCRLARLVAGRDLTSKEREQYGLPKSPEMSAADATALDEQVPLHAWQQLRFFHPADPAWHEAQARECLHVKHRFGFDFHLQRLARLDPQRADVLRAEAAGAFDNMADGGAAAPGPPLPQRHDQP
jgi:hypothetical protein